MQIDLLEPLLLVMQELRLAVLRTAVCARSSNSACCRWRAVSTPFIALLAAHVPVVHEAALALRLSRRPLRQAALQRAGAARLAPQRLTAQRDRVAHAHPGLLSCSTRGCGTYASDFLANSELFADSQSCWWQRADISARATELRAWMKDAADAHGTRLPEHQARHQPVFNRITDDAQIGIELMGDAAFMDAIQGAVERGMGIGDGVVLPIAFALLALMARSVGARAALGGGAVARRLGARRVRLG
jgi:hypothetical protein